LLRFRYTAVIVAALLVILALACFWVAAERDSPVAQSIWSNVGSALATIGLLGVLYDAILRPRLLADLVRSSDLQQSGIRALGKTSELRLWRNYSGGDVLMIIPNLPGWLEQGDWQELMATAASTNTRVTVYTHLDDAELEVVDRRIRADWDVPQAGGRKPSDRKSGIVIYNHKNPTNTMIYKVGSSAWVVFDSPFVPFVPGKAIGMHVERSRSAVWDWIDSIESRIAADVVKVTVAGNKEAVQAIVRDVPAQTVAVPGENS
jgi:hypothetical protein